MGQLGVVGHDLLSNRAEDGELGLMSVRGPPSGVPLAASGPPYFRAGFKISPDFLRINLAEYGECITLFAMSPGELSGTIPVKSSFSPFSLLRGILGKGVVAVSALPALDVGNLLDDMAPVMVCKLVSDLARTGCRRGMKSEPPPGAGGVASGETIGESEPLSGDVWREPAREDPAEELDPSGISVKPNSLGRRPRRLVSCNESAAIAMVRLGGDRTSGKTCRGTGIVGKALVVGEGEGTCTVGRVFDDSMGLAAGEWRGEGATGWASSVIAEIEGLSCGAVDCPRSGVGGCTKIELMSSLLLD